MQNGHSIIVECPFFVKVASLLELNNRSCKDVNPDLRHQMYSLFRGCTYNDSTRDSLRANDKPLRSCCCRYIPVPYRLQSVHLQKEKKKRTGNSYF